MNAKVTTTSKPSNPVFCFLDGRISTIRGIQGRFKHEVRAIRYPYTGWVESLIWTPTAAGRKTEAYEKTRRELGDEWVSDLTTSIDQYCEIAHRLGYRL